MSSSREIFDERCEDINAILSLVLELESPRKPKGAGVSRSAREINVLKGSIYLLLYNLVEATVSAIREELKGKILSGQIVSPAELSPELRRTWRKHRRAQILADLGENKDWEEVDAGDDCSWFSLGFEFPNDAGGNYGHKQLHVFTVGLGMDFKPGEKKLAFVANGRRIPMSMAERIKVFRNKLAHGETSFDDVGQSVSHEVLNEHFKAVEAYFEALLDEFEEFLENERYLAAAE